MPLTPHTDALLKKLCEAETSTFRKSKNLFCIVIRRLVLKVVRFAVFLFFWAIYPDFPRKWVNAVPELSLYCVTFHCVLCYWCQSPDAQEQKICKILPTSFSRYEVGKFLENFVELHLGLGHRSRFDFGSFGWKLTEETEPKTNRRQGCVKFFFRVPSARSWRVPRTATKLF